MSKHEVLPVVEPSFVADTFATGVLPPEDRGGHIRIVCYADRTTGDGLERIIVARVVFSREDFLAALAKVVDATLQKDAMIAFSGMAH